MIGSLKALGRFWPAGRGPLLAVTPPWGVARFQALRFFCQPEFRTPSAMNERLVEEVEDGLVGEPQVGSLRVGVSAFFLGEYAQRLGRLKRRVTGVGLLLEG